MKLILLLPGAALLIYSLFVSFKGFFGQPLSGIDLFIFTNDGLVGGIAVILIILGLVLGGKR